MLDDLLAIEVKVREVLEQGVLVRCGMGEIPHLVFGKGFVLRGYPEPLTVRDSTLSASTQAVLAAEMGQLQLAYDYLGEAAFMDLHDLAHNARDGLHMASLAGA